MVEDHPGWITLFKNIPNINLQILQVCFLILLGGFPSNGGPWTRNSKVGARVEVVQGYQAAIPGGNNPVTLNDQILTRNQPMSLSIGSEVGKLLLIAGSG